MSDHERIWLEPSPGADEEYGRQWCQHDVFGEDATEYVRADLCDAALAHPGQVRDTVAAYTVDHTGCDHMSRDIAGIERIAAAGSYGPTEVVYLYALALPLPVQEPVDEQWRYRRPGTPWSAWQRYSPTLHSYGDFEKESRPLYLSPSPSIPEEKGGTAESVDRLRAIETAAMAYVASVHGEPEKDWWDTEDGKEAPGADRFASDWAWKEYDDKKQKAFDDLRALLASPTEGQTVKEGE